MAELNGFKPNYCAPWRCCRDGCGFWCKFKTNWSTCRVGLGGTSQGRRSRTFGFDHWDRVCRTVKPDGNSWPSNTSWTMERSPLIDDREVVCIFVKVGTHSLPPMKMGVRSPFETNTIAGWHSGGGTSPGVKMGIKGITMVAQAGIGGNRQGRQRGSSVLVPSSVVSVQEYVENAGMDVVMVVNWPVSIEVAVIKTLPPPIVADGVVVDVCWL